MRLREEDRETHETEELSPWAKPCLRPKPSESINCPLCLIQAYNDFLLYTTASILKKQPPEALRVEIWESDYPTNASP